MKTEDQYRCYYDNSSHSKSILQNRLNAWQLLFMAVISVFLIKNCPYNEFAPFFLICHRRKITSLPEHFFSWHVFIFYDKVKSCKISNLIVILISLNLNHHFIHRRNIYFSLFDLFDILLSFSFSFLFLFRIDLQIEGWYLKIIFTCSIFFLHRSSAPFQWHTRASFLGCIYSFLVSVAWICFFSSIIQTQRFTKSKTTYSFIFVCIFGYRFRSG